MKKLLAILLLGMMVTALFCACGENAAPIETTISTLPDETTKAAETTSGEVATTSAETTAPVAETTETSAPAVETTASVSDVPTVWITNGTERIACYVVPHSMSFDFTEHLNEIPEIRGELFDFDAADDITFKACYLYDSNFEGYGALNNPNNGKEFHYDLTPGVYYILMRVQVGAFSVTNNRVYTACVKIVME